MDGYAAVCMDGVGGVPQCMDGFGGWSSPHRGGPRHRGWWGPMPCRGCQKIPAASSLREAAEIRQHAAHHAEFVSTGSKEGLIGRASSRTEIRTTQDQRAHAAMVVHSPYPSGPDPCSSVGESGALRVVGRVSGGGEGFRLACKTIGNALPPPSSRRSRTPNGRAIDRGGQACAWGVARVQDFLVAC